MGLSMRWTKWGITLRPCSPERPSSTAVCLWLNSEQGPLGTPLARTFLHGRNTYRPSLALSTRPAGCVAERVDDRQRLK